MPKPIKIEKEDALDRGIDEYAAILGDPEWGESLKYYIENVGVLTTPEEIRKELEDSEFLSEALREHILKSNSVPKF